MNDTVMISTNSSDRYSDKRLEMYKTCHHTNTQPLYTIIMLPGCSIIYSASGCVVRVLLIYFFAISPIRIDVQHYVMGLLLLLS